MKAVFNNGKRNAEADHLANGFFKTGHLTGPQPEKEGTDILADEAALSGYGDGELAAVQLRIGFLNGVGIGLVVLLQVIRLILMVLKLVHIELPMVIVGI